MRDKLLEAAETMVCERGVSGVSFQLLADAVGLSKPTVFHHFPNREALAQGLVERCRRQYLQRYEGLLASQISAPEKLRAIAALYQGDLLEGRQCLLGALSGGVAQLPPGVRQALSGAVAAAIAGFAPVFRQGRREATLEFEGNEREAATAFLALLQGLQVLARARGDYAALASGASAYIESLRA